MQTAARRKTDGQLRKLNRRVLMVAVCAAASTLLLTSSATGKVKYITFDAPDSVNGTWVIDINAKGVIVGEYDGGGPGAYVRAADGTFTEFGVSGAAYTFPSGINSDGTIAGSWRDSQVNYHGFIRAADGTVTTIDVPGAAGTEIEAINKWGVVTGVYWISNSDQTNHGFVMASDGTFTTFDAPHATQNTIPHDINSEGTVVGVYCCRKDNGFLRYRGGAFAKFGTDKGTFPSFDFSINPSGSITGVYQDTGPHGLLRDRAGTVTTFDAPGETYTVPAKINGRGVITGYTFSKGADQGHGFVRAAGGTITEFDYQNHPTYPASINDKGQVAGSYMVGISHGFLRLP
jgi:hypothetical protein